MYCYTRIQYVALAIILSNSGERMHRDRIPPQRMHAACRIVTRGSCCIKRFAEFNGNCESFCSLEQLVASLCAADEGKSASGTYHPKTEGGYIRYLYRPSGLTHGHNPPQTRGSTFGEGGDTTISSPRRSPKQPLPRMRQHDPLHGRQACSKFIAFEQGVGQICPR